MSRKNPCKGCYVKKHHQDCKIDKNLCKEITEGIVYYHIAILYAYKLLNFDTFLEKEMKLYSEQNKGGTF